MNHADRIVVQGGHEAEPDRADSGQGHNDGQQPNPERAREESGRRQEGSPEEDDRGVEEERARADAQVSEEVVRHVVSGERGFRQRHPDREPD